MALLNRVSRLFKADFHAVLDHIEEPEQTLKQAIREMEDELASKELRIAGCAEELETLEERGQQISETITNLDSELDLCFGSGKDDLAKSLIRRKLLAVRTAKQVAARIQFNNRFLEKERQCLEENHTTLEGLRQKAELFLSRTPADAFKNATGDFPGGPGDLSVSEDEIEIAFLREQAARTDSGPESADEPRRPS